MTIAMRVDLDEVLRRADAHIAKGEWEAACEILADAGSGTRVLDKFAFCLSRAKRYDAAYAVLEELQKRHPSEVRWPYMLGYQLYEQERYAEALPHFIAAWRANPRHLRNLYRLAQTRLHLGEVDKAKRGAMEVLRIWHKLPADARERDARTLAKASYLLGREQLKTDAVWAVELLGQAAQHDPADHDKHYLLGKALRKAGRYEEAAQPLRRALRIKPGQIYIELELAVTLARCDGGQEEAARLLGKVERRVNDWQALKAASLAARLSDGPRARRLLDRAARKGFVRRSPAYAAVAEQVNPVASTQGAEPAGAEPHELKCGRVDKVNAERDFGFLVDENDGTRRYFKLPKKMRLRRGELVIYRPREADKGPAADVIRLQN